MLANQKLLRYLEGLERRIGDTKSLVTLLRLSKLKAARKIAKKLTFLWLPGDPYITPYGQTLEPAGTLGLVGGQIGRYKVPFVEEDPWRRICLRLLLASQMKIR